MNSVLRLDEARRQHYLKAMGIPMWYARATLPGAKASPEFDFSAFEELQVEGPSRQPSGAGVPANRPVRAAADILKQVTKDLAPSEVGEKTPEPQAKAPPPVAPEQKPAPEVAKAVEESVIPADSAPLEVPEFCVRAYRAGSYLILNLAHPEINAHRESALLGNIATFCWGAAPEFLYEMAWPVFTNPRLPGQDLAVAQRVLKLSLQEYLDTAKGLILFGQPPLWPSLAEGETGEAGQVLALEKPIRVLATWSLGEMLLAPQRKRDVWLHLRRFSGIG